MPPAGSLESHCWPEPIPTVGEAHVQLLEERARVEKRHVAGDIVRVATTTQLREQQVQLPLERHTIEIERVSIGRVVDAVPEIREEGDVTIIPVMEEVMVVERRLVLKEEVRIRRVRTAEMHTQTVQLREQVATVSRTKQPD